MTEPTPIPVMDNSGLSDEQYNGPHVEYMTLPLDGDLLTQLRPLGLQGWEVCTVSRNATASRALLMRVKYPVVGPTPEADYLGPKMEHQILGARGDLVAGLQVLGDAGWRARAVLELPPHPITGEAVYQVLVVRTIVAPVP